jgi:hypothetical protein
MQKVTCTCNSWKGNVGFKHNGKIKHVNNVIYVLIAIENILSIGGIANKGCIMIFGSNNCWIMSTKKPFEVLGTRIRYELNDLYKIEIV